MKFIKDKYGQYNHPGKNTLIPDADGRITMKGVNYPVLGIDDLGNQQMMMPGGEYKFPGNSVYEIPLVKEGKELPNKYSHNPDQFPPGILEWNMLYDEMVRVDNLNDTPNTIPYKDFINESDENKINILVPAINAVLSSPPVEGDPDQGTQGGRRLLKTLISLVKKIPNAAPRLLKTVPLLGSMLSPLEAGEGSGLPPFHHMKNEDPETYYNITNPPREGLEGPGYKKGGELPKFQGKGEKAKKAVTTTYNFLKNLNPFRSKNIGTPLTPIYTGDLSSKLLGQPPEGYQWYLVNGVWQLGRKDMGFAGIGQLGNWDSYGNYIGVDAVGWIGGTPAQKNEYEKWKHRLFLDNEYVKSQGMGGLYIKSLLEGSPLLNNIRKSDNTFSVNGLQNFITNMTKNNQGAQVVADQVILQQSLDEILNSYPKEKQFYDQLGKVRIPFDMFTSIVQNNLVKYVPERTQKLADYNFYGLGYKRPLISTTGGYEIESSGTSGKLSEHWEDIEDYGTILFRSPELGEKLNRRSHFGVNDYYGHVRFVQNSKTPNEVTILETQSDEFQTTISKLYDNASKKLAIETQRRKVTDAAYDRWLGDNKDAMKQEFWQWMINPQKGRMFQAFKRPTDGRGYSITPKQRYSTETPEGTLNPDMAMIHYMQTLGMSKNNHPAFGIYYNMTQGKEINSFTNIGKDYHMSFSAAYQHWEDNATKEEIFNLHKFLQAEYKAKGIAYPNLGFKWTGGTEPIDPKHLLINGLYSDITTKISTDRMYAYGKWSKAEEVYNAEIANIDKKYDVTTLYGAQRKALLKNQRARLFGETLKYFGDRGYEYMLWPHVSTVAKVQGYPSRLGNTENMHGEILQTPWTELDENKFHKRISNMFKANTWGHTKIPTGYGPFVVIPEESSVVYKFGVDGSTSAVTTTDRAGNMINPPVVEDGAKLTPWRDNFFVSYPEDEAYGVERIKIRKTFWDNDNNKFDTKTVETLIPNEVSNNLQPGMYYVDPETGEWQFVHSGAGEEGDDIIKQFTLQIRGQNHVVKDAHQSANKFDLKNYSDKHQTVLKQYLNDDKWLAKQLGYDPDQIEIVRSVNGNLMYRFKIPTDFIINRGKVPAYRTGGEINNSIKGEMSSLRKFKTGGSTSENSSTIDYEALGAKPVTINGKTYYQYEIGKNEHKSDVSAKFGLWNDQAILNSINTSFGEIKDHPDYNKNINRWWAGDKVIVGGPEFNPHIQYEQDRNNYINSFKNISSEELWSVISALGHLETGSLVTYKKPEDRKYITGEDLDEYGNAIPGGLYEQDRHPFTGSYVSGMDDAYGYSNEYNALGRFGIKEELLNQHAVDALGYKEGEDWRGQFLKDKKAQQNLMQYLITDVYPKDILNLRHFYPEATSQYSDFELIAALHKEGYGRLKKQMKSGEFKSEGMTNKKGQQIDMGTLPYVEKAYRSLDPDVDISKSNFFIHNAPQYSFFSNIPKYKFGGDLGKISDRTREGVISDMLENGAFLPTFKQGGEKTIEGMFGNYNIKKGYDESHRIPFIEFKTDNENIENNRIYYDQDDETGYDDFNIIDIYKQNADQQREHDRVVRMINKYENNEFLTKSEISYLEQLNLLDSQPANKVVEEPKKKIKLRDGAPIPLEDIDSSKDLFNKTDGNNFGISLEYQINLYDAVVNSASGKNFNKLEKIYNRLNSLYYNDAKANEMTVFDYMKSLNN